MCIRDSAIAGQHHSQNGDVQVSDIVVHALDDKTPVGAGDPACVPPASHTAATASRPFSGPYRAGLAQLVARRSHNPKVVSSILTPRMMISSIATCRAWRVMLPGEVPGRRAPLRMPSDGRDKTMVRSSESSSGENTLPRSRRSRTAGATRTVSPRSCFVLRKIKKTFSRAGGKGTIFYGRPAQDLQQLPNSCSLKASIPTSSHRFVLIGPLILPKRS